MSSITAHDQGGGVSYINAHERERWFVSARTKLMIFIEQFFFIRHEGVEESGWRKEWKEENILKRWYGVQMINVVPSL